MRYRYVGAIALSRLRRVGLLGAVALSVAAVSTGCGDSSTTDATTADVSSGSAKGEPLPIGVMAPVETPLYDFGGDVAGVKAAAATINEEGGINGRPVKVVFCNTKAQGNLELACARKLISEGIIAQVAELYLLQGPTIEKQMAQRHIASIGYTGAQPAGYDGSNTFPLTWEAGSWIPCVSKGLAKIAGGNRVVDIALDVPTTEPLIAAEEQAAIKQGLTWLPPIKVPPTVTDFSPYVAKAVADRADIVLGQVVGTQALVRAASAADAPFTLCVAAGLTQAGGWENLGSATERLYIGATFEPLSESQNLPLMEEFLNSMAAEEARGNKYADTSPNNFQAQAMVGWLSVQAFAQVARKMSGPITAESFEAALAKSTVDMGGIIPNIDFASPPESGGPFKRVWNSAAYLWKYDPDTNAYTGTDAPPVANTLELAWGG